MKGIIITLLLAILSVPVLGFSTGAVDFYNVKDFGATGDGKSVDSPAIDSAINFAATRGGGTVLIPAGEYLCFSIHLKSNIELKISSGATLVAAHMDEHPGAYDEPEYNRWGDSLQYQDFGHSHFHNSLIWGENLVNVSISGSGLIYGKGLQRRSSRKMGLGNKAIALKNCRNVILKDFSVLQGGHFAILTTGVDNLTIQNLKIDTNRDAIDIDCCRQVHISNCFLNSPNDDALVLKTSFALGYPASCENITITACSVYGFDVGTFLDGTYQRTTKMAPDKGVVTGRIKLGTESNGDFRNISISNCTFEHCRGLALESVDGSHLENITVSNVVMTDILNAPFFFRLGARLRGPSELPVGSFKRVLIQNVVITASNSQYGSMLMGIQGHHVEDITLSDVWIKVSGGAPAEQSKVIVPELEKSYPDPQEFGLIPAWGFYIRHARNITMNNVHLEFETPDHRPVFILEDVQSASFNHIKTDKTEDMPVFLLKNVRDFSMHKVNKLQDKFVKEAKELSF